MKLIGSSSFTLMVTHQIVSCCISWCLHSALGFSDSIWNEKSESKPIKHFFQSDLLDMPPYGRRSLPQMQKHQSSSWRPFSESCFAVFLLARPRCQCQRFNLIWDKKGQIGQKLNLEINLWWAASSHCQPLINCDLSTICEWQSEGDTNRAFGCLMNSDSVSKR